MFESYSVAVRLKLLDSVSSGLIGLAGHFATFNRHVNASQANLVALENRLKSIKMMGFVGGAALGVGFAGLYAFKAPLEEAKQWQQEAARFASLGFGPRVNADAEQFARGMKSYGTSARENLTLLSDAMAVFKDLRHAEMAAPVLARMKFANEAVFGQSAAGNERKFLDLLKVIEFRRGLSSQTEFENQANYAQRVITGSRNRVDASQLLLALKTGGVSTSRLSNEAFYLGLEPLIQEFGGSRLGTGLMSVYQNLVQSRGTMTAQQELYRLGLLDPQRVQFNSLGMLKKALPGAFRGSDILEQEGPLALLQKVLLPAFAAKGITNEEGIIRELGMIMGNRTASGLMSRIYQQRATIRMQTAANRSAQDINQLTQTAKGTPEGKWLEMTAKYRDLLLELGTAVLPIAVKAVEGLTAVIKGVVSFAREFPTLTSGLTIGFGVLSALVATGGAITLATAGFKALGLALAISRGVGVGATLLEVAAAIAGTGGLVLALVALGATVAWLLPKLRPASKADVNDHPNEHWVPGKGRGGAGGFWEDNMRWVGPAHIRHQEFWDSARSQFVAEPAPQPGATRRDISPYIALPQKPTVNVTVHNKVDRNGLTTLVLQGIDKRVGAPQTGLTGFDGILQLSPAGGVGTN